MKSQLDEMWAKNSLFVFCIRRVQEHSHCMRMGIHRMRTYEWLGLKINNFKYNSSKGVKMGYKEIAVNLSRSSSFYSNSLTRNIRLCAATLCDVMNDVH